MSFLDNIFDIKDEEEVIGLTSELKSLYLYKKFQKENKSLLLVTSNLHEAGKLILHYPTILTKYGFFQWTIFLQVRQ
ncbi:MAG: hypothetical protein V8R01_02485 [Bacilli bacterium]